MTTTFQDYDHFAANPETDERISAVLQGLTATAMRALILSATPTDAGEDGLYYAEFLRRISKMEDVDRIRDALAAEIIRDSENASCWVGDHGHD